MTDYITVKASRFSVKPVARLVRYGGALRTIDQWADHIGVPYDKLRARFDDGWGIREALETPIRA